MITCYTYYRIQNWGWTNAPHLWFRKLLVSSLLSGKAWQECAQQTEKSHSRTNSAVSRQVYVHALLVQHLQSVFFQYVIWSKIRKRFDAEKTENWLKYTDCAELKKITSWIYSNCSILLYFSSPSNFVAVRFVWLKKYKCPTYLIFYFKVDFSKEN